MPAIAVGGRRISYSVRRSERARKKRIEVRPDDVRVVVPAEATDAEIQRFVEGRRRWIHNQTEALADAAARLRCQTPIGFHSGAKVLFRGRYLKLRVRRSEVEEPSLSYQNRFHIKVPETYDEDKRERAVRRLLLAWFEERLVEDVRLFIRKRGRPEGLVPRGIKVKEQKTLWGSCGRDRVLRLDRKLIRVPKPVLEYVVVHEICHLRHRDHSDEFWRLVKKILPDYVERKEWLDEHEVWMT